MSNDPTTNSATTASTSVNYVKNDARVKAFQIETMTLDTELGLVPKGMLERKPTFTQIYGFEKERFWSRSKAFGKRRPGFLQALGLFSIFSAFKAVHHYNQKSVAEREVAFRKAQLELPIEVIPDGSSVPWNRRNLNEWRYRQVRITGRPLHYKAMLVPRSCYGHTGYEYIVPFVLKENEDGSEQEGVLLSKGFLPHM